MRAVLFDLDGVLIDTYEVWHAVINALARDLGYPAISNRRMQAGWGQGVEADVRMFFPGSSIEAVETYYNEHFLEHVEHLRVTRGAIGVLHDLHRRGISSAVVTNTPAPLARRLLERAGLTPEALVGSSDVPRPKPAPDMVLKACELLAIEPAEAILVGDLPSDRDSAAGAGVSFVAYRWDGGQRIDDLAELLDLVSSAEDQ